MRKWYTCSVCDGDGRYECAACDGTGSITDDDGYRVRCENPRCSGGWCRCEDCNGRGGWYGDNDDDDDD